ncbi:hypothetical protein F383_36862 [Gossypium arboreum]|uniref:Uncharacterized protein n=1 Tax=Gossypium arboreum TaxID=29729 RepID=A0A0B0MAD2_GOSAR|nr:hypothetical protein F383_36862 [Gossypium arboreum]
MRAIFVKRDLAWTVNPA